MDTQRGQKLQGRPERQRASLLQQGESGKTGPKGPRSRAQDRQGRSEAKVLLRKDVWYEGQEHEFQDSQGPEQSYKQEP